MMEKNLLTERGHIYMGIDFGGGDALMTEHCLDDSEVGTAFEEGGSEAMA